MRRGVLVAAALGFALLWAPSASAAVFGSDGCGRSEFEPEIIGLACADGKVIFEVREWTLWGAGEAVGVGLLKHPDLTAPGRCQRTILACPWVESEGTATFSRPTSCSSNGRRQFTRLRIVTPNDKDPELRDIERDFSCGEYSSPRDVVRRLSTVESTRLMRSALARKPTLSFAAGYARRVKCNKRVSPIRVRCKMSWNVGDLSFDGRGVIWLTYKGDDTYWNFAYRIRKRNHYCLATDGRNCDEMIVVR